MASSNGNGKRDTFEVELPAGGKLHLQSLDEVEMFETARDRYVKDYNLTKMNDLALIGAILTQQLALYRAQQRMNGMEPVTDSEGIPTGEYRVSEDLKPQAQSQAQNVVIKAAEEIRAIEKALGIDKKTREAGGTQNVANYIATLKRAGREYGIHLVRRQKRLEAFANGLRWRIRVLQNADPEDRQYHGITAKSIIEWCQQELAKDEEEDKKFAHEKGKLYAGRL